MNELDKAHEETTRRNVQAILEHSNETRALVRELEKSITELKNMILQKSEEINLLRTQLATIQQKLYQAGSWQ